MEMYSEFVIAISLIYLLDSELLPKTIFCLSFPFNLNSYTIKSRIRFLYIVLINMKLRYIVNSYWDYPLRAVDGL